MGQFISNLFTKESAKRHLIQLGITAVLIAWSYVAISLLTSNWDWFSADESQTANSLITVVCFSLMFACVAIAGILTYWNAKKWMLPCLKRSGLYLLGAIPFVNLLVPAEMMNSWWEEIDLLNTSDGTVTTYYDRFGKLYSTDGSMPLIFAIPLGIIIALFKGVGMSVLNLLAAVGIPVLSPILLFLGMIAAQLLIDWSNTAAMIIAIVAVLAVVLVLVAHPIIIFVKNKNHASN